MKPEDKELIVKDLSARLPYEPIVYWENCNYGDKIKNVVSIDIFGMVNDEFSVEECKPYLRPMSSMTEEEREFLNRKALENSLKCIEEEDPKKVFLLRVKQDAEELAYLYKHHYDVFGLIPAGLAISTETFNPYVED